jgi:hypothetical protein
VELEREQLLESGPSRGNAGAAAVPRPSDGLEIPAPRGSGDDVIVALPPGRFLALSADAARLLRLIDGRRSLGELARLHGAERGRPISPDAVERLIRESFLPAGLVHFGEAPPHPGRARSHLWLRLPLLPARAASALGRRLAFLFDRRPAALGLAGALGLHLAFWLSRPRLGLEGTGLGTEGWIPAVALYLLGSVWHELGHAAALAGHGERPGAIGLGMYYAIPVFHSDVSRAWLLPPRARATVDVGGMHFQALFAGALCAAYLAFGGAAWAKAVVFTDLALLLNLNPFLRMDGYWLVADLTGTRELRKSSLELLRPSTRGSGGRFLAVYTAASLVYLMGLSAWMGAVVLPRAVTALGQAARNGSPLSFLFAGLVLAGTGIFLGHTAGVVVRAAGGRGLRETDSPGRVPGR